MCTTFDAKFPYFGCRAVSILTCNGPEGGASVQNAPSRFTGSLYTRYRSRGTASFLVVYVEDRNEDSKCPLSWPGFIGPCRMHRSPLGSTHAMPLLTRLRFL